MKIMFISISVTVILGLFAMLSHETVIIKQSTNIESTIETEKIENITEAPTLPYIDPSIVYISTTDKDIIQEEIKKCEEYLTKTSVQSEIERIKEILRQYAIDMKKIAVIDIPEKYNSKDFKSYEDYRLITWTGGPHYKLQHQYAYTNDDGIRMVNGRYCIALGSYFTSTIGQYIDIILANGTVIECVLGDQKSNAHTDEQHIAHKIDGSILEFIIDKDVISKLSYKMGDVSYSHEEWRSPVVQVIIYDINVFSSQTDE